MVMSFLTKTNKKETDLQQILSEAEILKKPIKTAIPPPLVGSVDIAL